jgi:hypothetical protein
MGLRRSSQPTTTIRLEVTGPPATGSPTNSPGAIDLNSYGSTLLSNAAGQQTRLAWRDVHRLLSSVKGGPTSSRDGTTTAAGAARSSRPTSAQSPRPTSGPFDGDDGDDSDNEPHPLPATGAAASLGLRSLQSPSKSARPGPSPRRGSPRRARPPTAAANDDDARSPLTQALSPAPPSGPPPLFCTNCRASNHTRPDCPEPSRCYVCLLPAHEAFVCVSNPVPGSCMFLPDVTCTICRMQGHHAKLCKSRGGPHHGRPGVQYNKGRCFHRPLVVAVSSDNGPTATQQREAREAICVHLTADMKIRFQSGAISDGDLFAAGLAKLGDMPANSGGSASKLEAALLSIRTAATASLVASVRPSTGALGDGAVALMRQRAVESAGAYGGRAATLAGQLSLHELKASQLDFHVVFGGRVERYRRSRPEGGDDDDDGGDGVPLDPDAAVAHEREVQAQASARSVQSAAEIVAPWPYKPGDEARQRERRQ